MTHLLGYRASLVLRDDAGEGIEIADFLSAATGEPELDTKLILKCIHDWQRSSESLPYWVLPKQDVTTKEEWRRSFKTRGEKP